MPMYEYACHKCKIYKEILQSITKMETEGCSCKRCGSKMEKLVSLPAKTPSLWNGGWTDGLSGYAQYDRGLGMTIYSETHRDKVLAERGLVRESDVGEDFIDRRISQMSDKKEKCDALDKRFDDAMDKFDGDYRLAQEEAMPAQEILQGKFDFLDD